MNLSGLLAILDKSTVFGQLLARLEVEGERSRLAIPDAAKPFVIAALQRRLRVPVFVLTAHAERAKTIFDELHVWLDDPGAVKLFPEPDALAYERVAWDHSTIRERLDVLWTLRETRRSGGSPPPLIVAGAQAVMQKTIAPEAFDALCHTVKRGEAVELDHLLSTWLKMGFEPATTVEMPGTFGRRGGIVDVFPPTSDYPVRLDLFGSEVDSIRLFDPSSQRSIDIVDSVTIAPPREVLGSLLGRESPGQRQTSLHDPSALLDLSDLQPDIGALFERELAQLARGEVFDEAEFYAGLVNQSTILDYLAGNALLIMDEPEEVKRMVAGLAEQAEKLRATQVERGDLPVDFPAPYHDWTQLEATFASMPRFLQFSPDEIAPDARDDGDRLPFEQALPYGGRLKQVVEDAGNLLKEKRSVVLVSQQSRRLAEILNERDFFVEPVERLGQLPPPGSLALVHGTLAEGWSFCGRTGPSAEGLVVLTDAEIFGHAKPRRVVRKRSASHQAFLSDLTAGDYVVHIEHGIGRFSRLTKMVVNGAEKEYLVVDYAEGDRLYVPTDQIDRVNRYVGAGEHIPNLTRLGTQEWARVKARVKKSVQHIAEDLLAIYSARDVVDGFAFSQDTVWQGELEASFPYLETPDQLEAIRQVKEDMEVAKPMDRLICGDVGYGKTEVALRAAFKAVMDGKQVAVLVPTTVLAQQHYGTFIDRMEAFPVNVEVLSRFRSDKEQRAVIDGLQSGKVDICIGTHRLLQKDVSFKDLGLLVIDEEQRFGVVHKELLKKMRTEVDVLTLTATPIPRTLHMSLAGVRDMSTIDTPPEERLPIKTYVTGYDDGLVRQAILREMDRGGQVFFVHNRVESIAHITNHLLNLVPEASFAVGHGQMPEEQLERVMVDFAAGKTDVLACTTIIESGLDMPNVNTIMVNRADHFGLAQLYQLRGRVGRGANRAYAYFFYTKNKRLTEQAEKRLKVISQATALGAGFHIAMKDLEIRGAGNLLGVEQSGHMSAVGFDLYCRLLAQAVAELKARRGAEATKKLGVTAEETPAFPSVDLPISAHIPESYVSDDATRLTLYQRLAQIGDVEAVEEMAQEMRDRFGESPEPVRNLLYVLDVKLLAAKAGARSVGVEESQIIVKFASAITADRARLQQAGGRFLRIGHTQLRFEQARLGRKWKELLRAVLQHLAEAEATPNPITPRPR
ncbi:MAG: transcription-repair coupling factor [Chloroflexi bacterium]|nr:transcription-repair coupling factor [Chloroflexota bacterium]